MARLPLPGQDNGTWGNVLNEYLNVSLDADGTVKAGAIDTAAIQDNSISGAKLQADSVTNTQLASGAGSNGQVLTKDGTIPAGFKWTSAAGSPDASPTVKGLVQLTGDLGGTATSPTVPALASKQAQNADLTAIASLSPSNDDILQRKAGAWTNRTPAQVKTDLVLAKGDVGLGSVDNTSDANKPVSSATTTALNAKADKTTTVSAGTGLTGGGDLSANRTLTVSYGATAGTAAQGNDGRITGAIQSSTATTKGDILAATAASTIARLGVGSDGQMLTATSGQSTGLSWTTPPGALMLNAKDNGLTGDGSTNDQPALQTLVNTLGAAYVADGKPRIIFCPAGNYSIRDNGTVWKSGVSLVGAGPGVTRFVLSNPVNTTNPTPLAAFTSAFHGASMSNYLADCTFANFEVDGSGVALAAYSTGAKALVLQYMVRARFYNLYLHGCGATGLGCDFLQDSIIDGVVANNNGRLNNGSQAGGAGIGIGVGGWGAVERTTISNCTAVGNGTHGIFVELQDNSWTRPRGVRITGCHAEGNVHGISDWGAEGLIVTGCTMLGNSQDGFNVCGSGVATTTGNGGMVTGCVIDANTLDGVLLGDAANRYSIRGSRISNNARHGIHISNPNIGAATNTDIDINDNGIYSNASAGIRVDAVLTDSAINLNRVRNNGTNTGLAVDARAGISINAASNSPTFFANRCWDNQGVKTQTYGIDVTATGTIGSGIVIGNNLNGNLTGAYTSAGSVSGGQWVSNAGTNVATTTGASTVVIDGPTYANGQLRYQAQSRVWNSGALTPSATANTNGTAATLSPSTGQLGISSVIMARVVFTGTFSAETVTGTFTATFSDNTTASATVTATIAGTQVVASGGLLTLASDGKYVKTISCALKSTIASSVVTGSADILAAQC